MDRLFLIAAGWALLLPACTHKVQVEPIKIEPIHITMDIHIKVDRALQDFFSFEKELAPAEGGTDNSQAQ